MTDEEILINRLIEQWETSGHPICPDPECGAYDLDGTDHLECCVFFRILEKRGVRTDWSDNGI